MHVKIKIKTLPITITGLYIDEDSQAYLGLRLGEKFFFSIQPQQAWALDEGVVYLNEAPNLQGRIELVTADSYNGVENLTRDPRVVRMARVLDKREVDGLTLGDLKLGRVFPPEE